MRKLLNTLYVTLPDVYLACDGENVIIRQEDEIKLRVPIHNLESIVCFNFTGASPKLMQLCCERGRVTGNVSLRRQQYRWADDVGHSTRLAKRFVAAKIANSRNLLQRTLRDNEDIEEKTNLCSVVEHLGRTLRLFHTASNLDEVRGMEGEAASCYFGCFNSNILHQKKDFNFENRSRRPPLDRVNALLSFFYTLLAHDVTAALETVGLDPQVGFLHRDRPGRQSLALDIMEELRANIVDRFVLTLINRNQIHAKDFLIKENGAVILRDDARKDLLTAWQKRKQEELIHPYLEEKIEIGLIPYTQAMLLARHIRGDLEDYPPFVWK